MFPIEFAERFLTLQGYTQLADGHCDIPTYGKRFPYVFIKDDDEYAIVFVSDDEEDFQDNLPPRASVESLMIRLMKSGEWDDPGNIRIDTLSLLRLAEDRGIVRHHKAVSLDE